MKSSSIFHSVLTPAILRMNYLVRFITTVPLVCCDYVIRKLTCSVRTIQYFTWYIAECQGKRFPLGEGDSLSSVVCSSGQDKAEESCYARLIVLIMVEKFYPPTVTSNSFVLFQYFMVLPSLHLSIIL